MNKFTEICEKNKAYDKLKVYYGDVYNSFFDSKRIVTGKMLEIGLTWGYSMKMWKEYFFNAEVYGMEYDMGDGETFQNSLKELPDNMFDNIHYGDQSNRDDLSKLIAKYNGNFDIIIDDGGHCINEQCISLGYLFPYVKSGGYYVVEDLHTNLVPFPNRWNIGLGTTEYNYKTNGMNFPKNGTPTKTCLEALEEWKSSGEISSEYMLDSEMEYLNNNIDEIEIFYVGECNREWGNKFVIAFIKKR